MTIAAPIKFKEVFTTGEFAKISNVAPRTASVWIDPYFEQSMKLKATGEWRDLEKLARQDRAEFSRRIAEIKFGDDPISLMTRVVLEGAPAPYHIPGSKDRRIPRKTVIAFLRAANMEYALPALGAPPSEEHSKMAGVIFASKKRSAYETMIREKLGTDYCCTSTTTVADTIGTIGDMKKQNGFYPVVIADSSLGMDELMALGKWYGKDVPIIAVLGSNDQPEKLQGYTKIMQGNGALSSNQIIELGNLAKENQFLNGQGVGRAA